MKVGDIADLKLFDGSPPEPARMVTAGFMPGWEHCRHCCAHTNGPRFPCCKCGAEFEQMDPSAHSVLRSEQRGIGWSSNPNWIDQNLPSQRRRD